MGRVAEEVGRGQVTEVVGTLDWTHQAGHSHPLFVTSLIPTHVTASWVYPNVRLAMKQDMKTLSNRHTTQLYVRSSQHRSRSV